LKFLVVGASGFLGRHIWQYLKSAGHEVVGTQTTPKRNDLVTFELLDHRIESCVDPLFFKTTSKVFVIICAALSQMDRCLKEKELSHKINVGNTIQLIQDIRKLNAVPVFISTNCVYNGYTGYYNEASAHDPISEYGRHKEAVEQFLEAKVPEAFILRLDKIVSDEVPGKHMFADWYQCLEENRPIVCFDQLFAPTYANDIAESILRACRLGLRGAYNVSNTEFFTRIELAKQFIITAGKKNEVILKTQQELGFVDARLQYSYMDPTLFIKATGMRFTSMRELMGSFIQKKIAEGKETVHVQRN
jgi:dTDP-4-dehydrorhamnose reductase